MLDCEAPDLVALEVRSIVIEGRGMRSQAMDLRAEVLASRGPSAADTLHVEGYVGGDEFMEEGGRYVVLFCGPDQVRAWAPLRSNDPAREIGEIDLPGVPGGARERSADGAADGAAGAGPPMRYFLEGVEVDASAFAELFRRLVVDPEALEAETVENPDGSYGGSGATYLARDGEAEYRYEVVTFRGEAGDVSESRALTAIP